MAADPTPSSPRAPLNDPRILGPIPTPPAQRWKEVRLLYLPRTIFAIGVIVAAWLWTSWVAPATLVAEAEVVGADVRSTQAGVVAALNVAVLQPVRAGQVVGQVAAGNPRLLDATLAVIRAEVGMLTTTMSGATDRQRVAQTFERMQLDWLKSRVDLAALRGKLQQAESDLARGDPLHRAGLITDQDYEQLKTNRDALVAQVSEQTQLVAHFETVLQKNAAPDAQAAALSTESALAAAIKVQDAKLQLAEAQLTPVPLVAPIDGVVATMLRRPGEAVAANEAVLHINATRSERITGILRQPLLVEPKAGMIVEVRTRSATRQAATSKIIGVGAAMEPIPPSLLAAMRLPSNQPAELGLRIYLEMPKGLNLRPGEHVDVTIH